MRPHTRKVVHSAATAHGPDDCCGLEAGAVPEATFRGGRTYKVRGMDCAEEVAVLNRAVGPIVGGADRSS